VESSSAGKNLVFLGDKLILSQHNALVAKKSGCIGRDVACRLKELILPLCSDLVRHTWSAGPSSVLSSTRYIEIPEPLQHRATKMMDWSISHMRSG